VDLLDEVAQHRLGDLEVGDDAVLEGPDGDDVAGRAPDHLLRLRADGEHLAPAARLLLHRDDGGLVAYDPFALHVDQRIGRSQIDREIVREQSKDRIESLHAQRPQLAESFRTGNAVTNRARTI